MRRRELLQLTGVAFVTATAGCLTTPEGDAGAGVAETPVSTDDTETPTGKGTTAVESAVTEPIYAFWSAYNEENPDALVDTYHPDSPETPSETNIEFQGTVTVERASVIQRSDGSAAVEVAATITGDLEATETQLYEVRRYRDQWKIWSWGRKDEGSRPVAPQVQFEFEYDAAATDDDQTGVLRITHHGGDNIDAEKLYIRGTGIVEVTGASPSVTASDIDWGSAAGLSDVSAGAEITIGVTADCGVRLVYESDGTSTDIGSYDGPAA